VRHKGWAAAAAALIVLLSSCGAETPSTGGDDATPNAIVVSDGKGGGADLFAAMAAAAVEAGSYSLEMDMDVAGEQIHATGAASFGASQEDVDMTMTMQTSDGEGDFTVLVIDGEAYMKFPPEAELPTDKAWLRLDPEGGDPVSQAFAGLVDEMTGNASLQSQFDAQAELFVVEEVGSLESGGVDLTEYRLTLDVADAAEFLGVPAGEELPFEELTYSLWVDDNFVARKMSSDLGGMGSMEIRVFDLGEPVEIEAPPADQVGELADVMAQGGTAPA
jgi:hypothetical protein